MNTSRIANKKAKDPFDKLIFEKGLRIKNILIEKDLDLICHRTKQWIYHQRKHLFLSFIKNCFLSRTTDMEINQWRNWD